MKENVRKTLSIQHVQVEVYQVTTLETNFPDYREPRLKIPSMALFNIYQPLFFIIH